MSLKNRISALAEEFSAGVLAAIRAASLEEILAEGSRGHGRLTDAARRGAGGTGGTGSARSSAERAGSENGGAANGEPVKRGRGRPRGSTTGGAKLTKSGRLARRSPEQIAQVVEAIVGALKKQKAGMRSEQLQKLLGLDKKEISGPLAEGLEGRKITKKGERRATTYFAR